jgi:dTDP-4-dehydrorhamnose reductase
MLEEGKEITIFNDQYRMPTGDKYLAIDCKISTDKKAT